MIFYEEILREFQVLNVKYILVGGIAFNLLGGMRSTADLDILAEMSDDNLVKIVQIMLKQGYHVKQPVDPMRFAEKKCREDWIVNKHMKAFNFYKENDFKEIDIIIDSPVTYDEAITEIEKIKINDLILPVISIDNLIEMKKTAGRDIDKIDIQELQKIKKLQESA